MTIKCMNGTEGHSSGLYSGDSYTEECHVCGWKIDISDYYEVTKGKYGERTRRYYHLICYPPFKRCKDFRVTPATYHIENISSKEMSKHDRQVTYPIYIEGPKK